MSNRFPSSTRNSSGGNQDDGGALCSKLECQAHDIDCLMNKTKSIQYQFISLPTYRNVPSPVVLLNVQTVGYSVFPNLRFSIVSGNDRGQFDVTKTGNDRGKKGEPGIIQCRHVIPALNM